MKLFDVVVLGNPVWAWAVAAALAAGAFGVMRLILRFGVPRIARLTHRLPTLWPSYLADALTGTKGLVLAIVALRVGSLAVSLPARVSQAIAAATVVALLLQAGLWGSAALNQWLHRYREARFAEDRGATTTVTALAFGAQLVLWSALLLLSLDNLGINVTALVAGLGIGGVAVALAVQNILGDLFASLAIMLDRPFVLGDFLALGEYLGSVERIGLKTTRIRSLSGEQLVLPNADLLNSRIRNYGRMEERRVVFPIRVTYATPRERLAEIPRILRHAVEAQDRTRFDRAHFSAFGEFSLDFEVVYYMLTPDYNAYMDAQQAINLYVVDRFVERGIAFAQPTQTVHLERSPDGGPRALAAGR